MFYQQLAQHSHWSSELFDEQQPANNLSPWLESKGSLTAALIDLSNDDFKVIVLSEEVTTAHTHEQTKLKNKSDQDSLIREVELHIHNKAVVFARSIIPLTLVNHHENSLANLGTKPLGHLLFKEGRPRASRRDFAHVEIDNESIHARRTPYEYQGYQVLVSEFFLPEFKKYI